MLFIRWMWEGRNRDTVNALRSSHADIAYPYNGIVYQTSAILRRYYLNTKDIKVLYKKTNMLYFLCNQPIYRGDVFVNRKNILIWTWKMKDIMDGGMNIMTAIIDSQTLGIMYIGLMLLYSIYVIREKRIVLSAQKHFTIYFPMNYLEYQIAQIRATELHYII